MKKMIGLALASVLLISAGGCAKKKAELTVGTETAIEQAIIAMDKYFDQEISAAEAKNKINSLTSGMTTSKDSSIDEMNAIITLSRCETALRGAADDEAVGDGVNGEELAELIDRRNELAAYVGVKER